MATNTEAFGAYKHYCQAQGKSSVILHLAYAYFEEQVREQIDQGTKKGTPMTPDALGMIQETLSAPLNIRMNVTRAEQDVEQELRNILKPISRQDRITQFWIGVGGNLLASFLYSVIIFIIVVIAKDQVADWLRSLIESTPARPAP
jgi:hypothetical protein